MKMIVVLKSGTVGTTYDAIEGEPTTVHYRDHNDNYNEETGIVSYIFDMGEF